MHPEALGYILRLPRIIQPSSASLYILNFTNILINNKVEKYILPKHAVVINCTLKVIVVLSCFAWRIDNYMCSATLHTRVIYCITNFANCFHYSKICNEIF